MPFVWKPEHSVGHPELDAQHQEIYARVNAFLEAMQNGRGTQESARLLTFLQQYAQEHFALEEREMAATGFPGLSEHAAAHAGFAERLAHLKSELLGSPHLAMPVLQIQRDVCDWLTDHVACMDAVFGRFLRSKR